MWIFRLMAYIQKKIREDREAQTRSGWHEDHNKVELVKIPYKEKIIVQARFPRSQISISMLIR